MSVSMTWPQACRNECTVDGQLFHLTPMEAAVLTQLLLTTPDRFVSHGDLLDALWPVPDDQPLEWRKCVAVYLSGLRKRGVTIELNHMVGWRIPRNARGSELQPARLAA